MIIWPMPQMGAKMIARGSERISYFLLYLATLFLLPSQSNAQNNEDISTTILQCYYPGFSTSNPVSSVTRVESTGTILPQISLYMPCVEAFNILSMAGFKLVHSFVGTTEGGAIDGSDFTVWRTRYEICPGTRSR